MPINVMYRLSTFPLVGACADRVEGCRTLRDEGKCESDPVYMLANCKKTCDACFVTSREYVSIDEQRKSLPLFVLRKVGVFDPWAS